MFICEYKDTVERKYTQVTTSVDLTTRVAADKKVAGSILLKKLTQMAPLIELDGFNRYPKFCLKKSTHHDLKPTSLLKSKF